MLTRKRNRRAIMVILIIIAVIFILHNKGYCAQTDSDYTTDTTYFILEEYNDILDDFVVSFDTKYGKSQAATDAFNAFFSAIQSGYYPYFYLNSLNYQYVTIWMYNFNDSKTIYDTSLVYNDYMRVPSTGYNVTIPEGRTIFSFNKETKNFASNIISNGSRNARCSNNIIV